MHQHLNKNKQSAQKHSEHTTTTLRNENKNKQTITIRTHPKIITRRQTYLISSSARALCGTQHAPTGMSLHFA